MRLTEMGAKPTTKQMNKVMESRFGFAVDFKSLTLKKAYTMATAISESLDKIKRTHGVHTAEKNPKYMEMLMMRESLHRWMVENKQQFIAESEMAKSQAILAAKDMVDSIQDMLEKISKMQNEQLPALLDTIRDQISTEQAEAYKGSVSPLLQNLAQTLQQGRETADSAARALAGEQQDQPMDMGMGGEPDLGPGMGGGETLGGDLGGEPSDLDMGDDFGATDASAGGAAELGRETRESRNNTKRRIAEGATQSFYLHDVSLIDKLASMDGVDVEPDESEEYSDDPGSEPTGTGEVVGATVTSNNPNVTKKLMAFAQKNPTRLSVKQSVMSKNRAEPIGGNWGQDSSPALESRQRSARKAK